MKSIKGIAEKARRFGAEAVALMLLVPLAIIFMAILFNKDVAKPVNPDIVSVKEPVPTVINQMAGISTSIPSRLSVTLVINANGKTESRELAITQGETVADVLKRAKESGYEVVTKDFGQPLGVFVESINGVANEPQALEYWTLYVNGERSLLGASGTKVNAGDKLEWRLERITEE